jgi:hypothetical protein
MAKTKKHRPKVSLDEVASQGSSKKKRTAEDAEEVRGRNVWGPIILAERSFKNCTTFVPEDSLRRFQTRKADHNDLTFSP